MQIAENIKKRLHSCAKTLLLMVILAAPFYNTCAQVFDNSRQVDTLTFAERLSIRTNITDWVLTVPNIGIEYDLRSENWNRYAVNVNVRWRPKTSGTYVRPLVFDLFEVAVEGRMYWHERKAEPMGYLKRHNPFYFWDKLFSCRRMLPKHPRWVFYRGVYLSYSDFSVLLTKHGRQGSAVMGGVTWGFVKPFLAFANGNSIDMEFGVSVGAALAKYDGYSYDDNNNCYPKHGGRGWHVMPYPVVRDLHAALVYRLGHYPIQKKYRWRYDVDLEFHDKLDSISHTRLATREQNYIRDSVYNVVAHDFRLLYDSCVAERHKQLQAEIDAKSPKRLELDSIKARKQFIRDSIQARKDSLIRAKHLEKNPKLAAAAKKSQAAKEKLKEAKERIEKENESATRPEEEAVEEKTETAAPVSDKEAAKEAARQKKEADRLKKEQEALAKKAEREAKQAKAREAAERMKERMNAQKNAKKGDQK